MYACVGVCACMYACVHVCASVKVMTRKDTVMHSKHNINKIRPSDPVVSLKSKTKQIRRNGKPL